MIKKSAQLTTAQFAKLHEVNKRTLHYYDYIGLFSPNRKGENGYRYYDASQSIDFEYIRMLKDLNMSIEEVGAFVNRPSTETFMKLAKEKEEEINAEIRRLKRTRQILRQKKEQLQFCEELQNRKIKIQEFEEEKLLVLPFDFHTDELSDVFSTAKNHWNMEQIRMGIGSYLSLDKVLEKNFETYDGIFSPALKNQTQSRFMIRPRGKYLCGYQKGTWDELPQMYEKILAYAEEHHMELTGYAYELGMNELVASHEEDYITQIAIKIKETKSSVF